MTTEKAHEVFLLGHPEVSASVQAGVGDNLPEEVVYKLTVLINKLEFSLR